MQFQATCQGNTLNIKKTLAELHIKKGDVIDLITIPGSIGVVDNMSIMFQIVLLVLQSLLRMII